MHRLLFQATFKRATAGGLGRRLYSSQPSFSTTKRCMTSTVSAALVASGLTYTVMANQQCTSQATPVAEGASPVDLAKQELDNLEVIRATRADPDYFETDPYQHLSEDGRLKSLTAGSLRGPGKIILPPVLFYHKSLKEVVAAVHLGTNMCGHQGIVHGGLIATLLDEILACAAIPALPNKVGFTANLNIDYRQPLFANQWVILRGRLEKSEGRKAYVVASIESADGKTTFAEAKSLYVGPKKPIVSQ